MIRRINDGLIIYGSDNQIARKAFRRLFRLLMSQIQNLFSAGKNNSEIILYAPNIGKSDRDEIENRLNFFAPDWKERGLTHVDSLEFANVFSRKPILSFGSKSEKYRYLCDYRSGFFDINFRTNPMDGWAWCDLANYIDTSKENISDSFNRFQNKINELREMRLGKSYIFGTGPSLEKASQRDWADGYRIVCNTIVRDPELWKHIDPHIIVAGDAIYHFGFTRYAKAFREDLAKRLEESETVFIYPQQFGPIVRRSLGGQLDQCIPIPCGWKKSIHYDLTQNFSLPNLGNVLGLLLLPLAGTLSDEIYLWGFDGRAPDDKLFWSNSNKQSYPEYLEDLQIAHPKFFDHYVPASNPTKYVKMVQGDVLDTCMQIAERHGKNYHMMHPSWTDTLQKRYQERA